MRSPMVHREVRELADRGWPDRDIAEWLGLPRTTVRDIRAPRCRRAEPAARCPRCWQPTRPVWWWPPRYSELLGFYLGDGCISQLPRTYSLRISLDANYPLVVGQVEWLLGVT